MLQTTSFNLPTNSRCGVRAILASLPFFVVSLPCARGQDFPTRATQAHTVARALCGEECDKATFLHTFVQALADDRLVNWGSDKALPGDVLRLHSPGRGSLLAAPEFQAALSRQMESVLRGDYHQDFFGGELEAEYPDCVAVGSIDRWCCSGVLIGRRAVLTAAHCTQPECKPTRVYSGADVSADGLVRTVLSPIRPEDPDQNDVQILILEAAFPDFPVRPLADHGELDSTRDELVHVVGFGPTGLKRGTDFGKRRFIDLIVATPDCEEKFAQVRGCSASIELLAGLNHRLHRGCKGDSGSPFYVATPEGAKLGGVLSRGTKYSGNCGDGVIFVRAHEHRAWIEKVLDEHGAR